MHPVEVTDQVKSDIESCLKTLDGIITPVGKVTLLCRAKGTDVVPLFGLPGCLALNLVQQVNSMASEITRDNLVLNNIDVVSGLGCLPQEGKIVMKVGAEPVYWPPRRVYQAFQVPHKAELDRLEEKIVIQWISNLAIIEKHNCKLSKENSQDITFSSISKIHLQCWPGAYYKFQDNLHIEEKILSLGSKIVIPTAQ
ncbi:hypothetical protein PR048_012884 [Dryococelus australis]|uniref:Uncharacterized protein n=1 Tax=Dryococelus australis TaxID=614101 RepID=A0ABQ9HR15_9NEOP|nr:hypothetical protein PR048_012884 [Dryococelus australis]